MLACLLRSSDSQESLNHSTILINCFNRLRFFLNDPSLLTTNKLVAEMSALKGIQDMMSGVKLAKQMMANQDNGGSGTGEKRSKKLSVARVTPAGDADDTSARLTTSDESTPIRSSQEEEETENHQEPDEDREDISDEECEELDNAFSYLMKLVDERMLTVQQAEDLASWADEKLEEGQSPSWIAAKLVREKKRKQIMSLPRFAGRERMPQICLSYSRKSKSKVLENMTLIDEDPPQRATPISGEARISTSEISGEEQWYQFRDEYQLSQRLDLISVEVWNATMDVKIKQAEALIKELTAQIANKKVSKFKPNDVFDRFARDLKGELITVPLCANRLEVGHLVHPRILPDPNHEIFKRVIDGSCVFDAKTFGKALMLWTLLEDVRVKMSGFIYSIITYSMQDNLAAQDVIRADNSRDFFVLFKKLRERFQINSDLEKERLLTEFYKLVRKPTETLREYWGRMQTLVAEIQCLGRTILEDDLKRTFFRELPESGENNFLQLSTMEQYKANLNDLCLEVIRRNEELESSLGNKNNSVNFVAQGSRKFNLTCYKCNKPGHKAVDCKSKSQNDKRFKNHLRNSPQEHDKKKSNRRGQYMTDKSRNRGQKFNEKRGYKNNGPKYNKDQSNKPMTAGNVNSNKDDDSNNDSDHIIECYLCNQRNDHTSAECPNCDAEIKMKNNNYKMYQANNVDYDKNHPKAKIRVCVVTIVPPSNDVPSISYVRGQESDFFTVRNRYGPEFAMLSMEGRIIVIDSGASRSMFASRAMFEEYQELQGVNVYTASGEAIPVFGSGTVGGIPNCLHVPYLEKDLISVPHLDVELGWKTSLGDGVGVITDRSGKVVLRGQLDKNIMLYAIDRNQLLGDRVNSDEVVKLEAQERALAVMTKCEYVNKLHDVFHSHARRLEAFVKNGVVAWPFDPKKVKPVNFKKCLMPCDACGLAKTTRVTFRGKVMTHMTIGSVWQTDVSGKWSVPSLQGNQYIIGFMERTSRKLFLYFSKNKDVYAQTKDLIEAEIPKLRARHSLRDFIIHSDVGEFQSDKIRAMVRSYGGEIQKGSAYTPEHQCFIERAWRTIKEMASTMIIAAGLSEQYWECAQMYAMLIHNRTVRPTEVPGEMKSPDDIYYDVPHDMQQFEPFGCKAYVYIAKEVRRKNHKGRAELAIFVGFEDNTVPGYKFYRPLYRDFITTAHCKFLKFIRRTDINLTPETEGAELKDGTVDDFRYLENTIHVDDVDGLVYETTRVVEEVHPRRGTFLVAYRRPIYRNGARGPEEREAIHVRDVEKMTAVTDESIIEEYGVSPEEVEEATMEVKVPTQEGESELPAHLDEGNRSVVVPSTYPQLFVRGSDASGVERAGPLSGHRRERAVQRLEQVGVETSIRRVSLSRGPAKKRSRVITTIRLGKDSRSAPRGETQEEKLTPMTSYSRMS